MFLRGSVYFPVKDLKCNLLQNIGARRNFQNEPTEGEDVNVAMRIIMQSTKWKSDVFASVNEMVTPFYSLNFLITLHKTSFFPVSLFWSDIIAKLCKEGATYVHYLKNKSLEGRIQCDYLSKAIEHLTQAPSRETTNQLNS